MNGSRILSGFRAITALTVFFGLAACSLDFSSNQDNAPRPDNLERLRQEQGSIFGESLSLGGTERGGDVGGVGVAVNSYLWRASLDTISFFPMAQVDAFGGVIITEWYALPESPNERYKVNVYILGRQLRSDGVRVSMFKQVRSGSGWQDVPVPDDTAVKLENSILTRARQMRISSQAQVE